MEIPFYQVDAFSSKVFRGNPASVCLLEAWLEDYLLQSIAEENNLSETAFLVPVSKGKYSLRWFTPKVEVDLCGHATLASAFVIFSFIEPSLSTVEFDTLSGTLIVNRAGKLLSMDFPSRKPEPFDKLPIISKALGIEPSEVLKSRDLMVVFEDEDTIRKMNPDFEILKEIPDVLGVIVTAPGKQSDFVSRFFAPKVGVLEDPVTGSSHCTLIPYWAERLGKNSLYALQLSKRGGELFCENKGDRVTISGQAVLYAKGKIYL